MTFHRLEERKRRKRVGVSYTCSVDAFRRNARTLQKEGYPAGLAFSQAYSALAFACERTKRDAGTILTAPNAAESLTLREVQLLLEGYRQRLKI